MMKADKGEQIPAEPSTGSGKEGHVEAPDELEAIEAEIIDPEENENPDDVSAASSSGDFIGADACSGLCSIIFDMLASRRGEHWRLSQPESEQLGGAVDAVLGKYLPGNLERWGPEITLATILSMIVLPRMKGPDAEA